MRGRLPYAAFAYNSDARVITAEFVVHVIDERTFVSILKKDPYKAEASRKLGVPFFYDFTRPPQGIIEMFDSVAEL